MNWELEKIYLKQIHGTGCVKQPRHSIHESIAPLIRNNYSRQQIASLITAQDTNLVAGSLSKDVRIQAVGVFDPKKFPEILEKAGLNIIRAVKPGDIAAGSTSSQLLTYIVSDPNGKTHPVVLGKGSGFSTRHESFQVDSLRDQLEQLISAEGGDYINLSIDGDTQKVNGVVKTPGTPKCDIYFVYNNKPVLFISHKSGTTAAHHQQYGGITPKSGDDISNHPEVKDFISTLAEQLKEGVKPAQSFFRKIKDDTLKKLSMFGNDYTDTNKQYGLNNVNALIQGNIEIKPLNNNEYTLEAIHIVNNGDLPTGGYEPVLFARYGGRERGSHNIKGLRTAISPIARTIRSVEI